MGVDAVAFVSMSASLLLGEPLAAVVVAVMYAGGNLLEDFAVARAERDLKSLTDRAPRIAHRRRGALLEDIPIEHVVVGDTVLVRAGEVIPVDGVILAAAATLDEAALTGEPIPVTRPKGDPVHSGTINAGDSRCRRKHIRGHRQTGDRGANGEGTFHPACRSLCFGPAAGNARVGGSSLAVVG
jgi:cation transport ATPase